MSFVRRIGRLLRLSRIRLPCRPLVAGGLRIGDWIQVGATTWRVVARRFAVGGVVFRLRSIDGRAAAVLAGPRNSRGRWTLSRDGVELLVPPELLVVFPLV